ncbi:DsbA family protein [Caldimonas tepidiphila]|uniref:DsbA family protein n=1 Tax=Caldimonas tepidiphila TaxID=2315841 RepID=UPI000E5BF9DC|nr:DsbA family protein [Caldimonas tepidiphila]
MTAAVLHYLHDPRCGWCYAAEALASTAAALPLSLRLHGGGLFPPGPLPQAMREHIRVADARIAALSGQVFDAAYLDGLLADPQANFGSRPAIAAVLAAEAIDPAAALPMLQALQHAHYRRGLHIADMDVQAGLAASLGLDRTDFEAARAKALQGAVDAHIAQTRRRMAGWGLQGFPSFVLEHDGREQVVPHQDCYGSPGTFAARIGALLAARRG